MYKLDINFMLKDGFCKIELVINVLIKNLFFIVVTSNYPHINS